VDEAVPLRIGVRGILQASNVHFYLVVQHWVDFN
jgi:hypothetical protein